MQKILIAVAAVVLFSCHEKTKKQMIQRVQKRPRRLAQHFLIPPPIHLSLKWEMQTGGNYPEIVEILG
ncbi:MAG: hypothetical protein WDO71_25645 [Bacteroidota bacterium]